MEVTGFTNLPDRKPMTDAEKEFEGKKTSFRYRMKIALRTMEDLCGTFDLTTHGVLFAEGHPTLEGVCAKLKTAWDDPTAYNLSNLEQYLNAFLKD